MTTMDGAILDFKRLDLLGTGISAVHRLDARAKVLVTLVFIVSVVSFDRYVLGSLLPFFLYPAVMLALGDLPAGYLAKKVALVIPFAFIVGMLNPLFDRQVLVSLGPFGISGGWLSCGSIVIRAILTVGASLVLVAVTGFPAICQALERLGMPRAFAVQLLFLYRYIFVLTEEGARAARARELRSVGQKGMGPRVFASLVGNLLLRTWQRAERIHMAMLARGFAGEFHARLAPRCGTRELFFVGGWTGLFIVLRLLDVTQLLGQLVMRMLS
jgi:cobalt/nickel transport system permease protein